MGKILYLIVNEDKAGIDLALENNEDDVTILLLQDAVYFATKKGTEISQALQQNKKVFVSQADVTLRGIQNMVQEGVQNTDYGGIIDITFTCDTIINF